MLKPVYFVLALGFALIACDAGPKGSRGFRLPDGDFQKGKAVFLKLNCNQCHSVVGEVLPASASPDAVAVALGGEVRSVQTYGDLVTSIINPSHKLSWGYSREVIAKDGQSRMTNFNEVMTVQEMIDLVAFLQPHYKLSAPPHYKVGGLPMPPGKP